MFSLLRKLHAKSHPKESSIDTKPNDSIEGSVIDPKEGIEEIETLQPPHDLNFNGGINTLPSSGIIQETLLGSPVSGSNPGGNLQPLQELKHFIFKLIGFKPRG